MLRIAEEILLDHIKTHRSVYLVVSTLCGEGVPDLTQSLYRTLLAQDRLPVSFAAVESGVLFPSFPPKPDKGILLIAGDGILDDSAALSYLAYADCSILVIRAARTDRRLVNQCIACLKDHGMPILGSILNYGTDPLPETLKAK